MNEPERTLAILSQWAEDGNCHIRRLVSEGTRPRLPWAMQLKPFIQNPSPVLEIQIKGRKYGKLDFQLM